MSELFKNALIFNLVFSVCMLPFFIYIRKNIDKYKNKKLRRIFSIILVILYLPFVLWNTRSLLYHNFNKSTNTSDQIVELSVVPAMKEIIEEPIMNANYEINIKNDTVFSIYQSVPYIWVSFSLMILIYNMIVYCIFNMKIKKSQKNMENVIVNMIYRNVKYHIGVESKVKLTCSNAVKTPISIGFIQKRIVLPIESYTNEEYYYVLKHELTHIKNKDLYLKLFILIAKSIYWFNPIIYFYSELFGQIIELNCDEDVVANESEEYRKNYLETLLSQIEKSQKEKFGLSMNFANRKEDVMSRFSNVMNANKKMSVASIVTIFSVILVIVAVGLALIPNINFAKEEKVILEAENEIEIEEDDRELDEEQQEENENTEVIKETKENFEESENVEKQSDVIEENETKLVKDTEKIEVEKQELEQKETSTKEEIKMIETDGENREKYSTSFAYPVAGEKVISILFSTEANHSGVDFAGTSGEEILASKDGTVMLAEYKGSYGNLVVIEHEDGYRTFYAHCSELTVSQGDIVSKGDVIAKMGSTGNSTGPHLHFEIRNAENTPVNPMDYLK